MNSRKKLHKLNTAQIITLSFAGVIFVGGLILWLPFCAALTPTVLPNSFGVPPDLSFSYLLRARGLPRYGFCALEMP